MTETTDFVCDGTCAGNELSDCSHERRWGVWAEPSATNKVGTAGWLPDHDYDTGEIGWSKAEATRRCRDHNASIMRAHWTYSVRPKESVVAKTSKRVRPLGKETT